MTEVEDALARVKAVLSDEESNINDAFDKALQNLLSLKGPDALRGALLLLDDKYDLQDLMGEMLHEVERFDCHLFVDAFFDVLIELKKKSPDWASQIMVRCLNSERCTLEMKERIGHVDAETAAGVKEICRALKERNAARFGESVDKILG